MRIGYARVGHAPGSRITRQTYVHAQDHMLQRAVLELPAPKKARRR